MENNSYVYRHKRFDKNEIFYIGIGKISNYKRAYTKHHRNIHWNNIINKTEYSVEILVNNMSWEEACELEEFLILLYGRIDLKTGTLVNLTNGGDGRNGYIVTEDRKIQLSKLKKGVKRSKDTCDKISKARKGMKFTEEHRENLRKNIGIKIIDTVTGKIYNSISEVSRLFPISKSSLYRYLNGERRNKTNFEYYK